MLSTVDKPEDKREKLKKLREFHQIEFEKLGVPNAVFIPKMAYQPYGKTEKHIAFFLSEINRGEDVYVEFCSKDLDPEDPKRTLYKWLFNAHYQTEYDVTEPHAVTGHVRYLIPVAELVVVKVNIPEETISEAEEKAADIEFSLDNPDEGDIPMNQMTMRDYAAIHLKKPVSRKKWLNDIITSGY
jgi:hypothetical protein